MDLNSLTLSTYINKQEALRLHFISQFTVPRSKDDINRREHCGNSVQKLKPKKKKKAIINEK